MMTGRYPLNAALLTAAECEQLLGVKPQTLRQWVARGHVLKRNRDEYDMGSLMNYLEQRGDDSAPSYLRLA